MRLLVKAYSESANELDHVPDRVERELGYAALRTNVDAMKSRLHSRGGVSHDETKPLDDWLSDFQNGKVTKKAVEWMEARIKAHATKVMRQVLTAILMGKSAVAGCTTLGIVVGIALGVQDFGRDATAGFIKAVVAGTVSGGVIVAVLRKLPAMG